MIIELSGYIFIPTSDPSDPKNLSVDIINKYGLISERKMHFL